MNIRLSRIVIISIGIYYFLFFHSYLSSLNLITSFSNIIFNEFSTTFLQIICALGMIASILFTLVKKINYLALFLYLTMVLLFNVDFQLNQLHYSYLSLIMIHISLFHSENESNNEFNFFDKTFDSKLIIGLFIMMTITISGISKLFYNDFITGFALKHIMSRPYYLNLLLKTRTTPISVLAIISYCILLIEILSLPAFLFKQTRKIIIISNLLNQYNT